MVKFNERLMKFIHPTSVRHQKDSLEKLHKLHAVVQARRARYSKLLGVLAQLQRSYVDPSPFICSSRMVLTTS